MLFPFVLSSQDKHIIKIEQEGIRAKDKTDNPKEFFNSVIVDVITFLAGTLMGVLAGYAYTKYKVRGRNRSFVMAI